MKDSNFEQHLIDKAIEDVLLEAFALHASGGVNFSMHNENDKELVRSIIETKLFDETVEYGDEQAVLEHIYDFILETKKKHPERQAYNKNGILVTFPTPEYKQRAIKRGTHTEENPKASQANIDFPQDGASTEVPAQDAPKPTEPINAGQTTPSTPEQQPSASVDARTPKEKAVDAAFINTVLLSPETSPESVTASL